VLKEIAGHNDTGATIGHLALGEYVYHPELPTSARRAWMQLKAPEVRVQFPVKALVSRRSFIFARAGFGKSNLNKLLFSTLYQEPPMTEKRGGNLVPVGTVIFDPDGEYFWPDDRGRPGLCDVPYLEDKLVVFTSRKAPSGLYDSFVASQVRLDIRQLRPGDVISIALPPERQEQQNVTKLRSLSGERWRELVNVIHADGNGADIAQIAALLNIDPNQQQAEALAARSNMTTIVRMLHDPSSQMMGLLLHALEAGKLCVVDVSQMRGTQGFVLAGIILRQIFSRNQEEFTKAEPRTIPTIAVIEEAQSVLNERAAAAEPFIAWVKEGRKYDLGAVLVTQQPGSIPDEILSQGDNWFIFHLLSAGDLGNVRKANSHFSNDLLSSLLNEPIVGQGVFWSSAKDDRAYPIPLRVLSFGDQYGTRDPEYNRPPVRTFASELRSRSAEVAAQARELGAIQHVRDEEGRTEPDEEDSVDNEQLYARLAERALSSDEFRSRLESGLPWFAVILTIAGALPSTMPEQERKDIAASLVASTLNAVYGEQDGEWHSYRNESTGKRWVRRGPKP
jgi:uncharacterized protein